MTASDKTLATFQTRVRQMILRFEQLQEENVALRRDIEGCKAEIADLKVNLENAAADHDAFKMAKMLEVTDGDIEQSRARLSKLIRDVNRCIAILSDEK